MDLLSGILSVVKMSGSLYFRTSFNSPWGVAVPQHSNVARFHYVHRGICNAKVANQAEPISLQKGDLIIITQGAEHQLCEPADATINTLDSVIEESGFNGHGALVMGDPNSGTETELICGHFAFDPGAKHIMLDSLPDYILIKDYGKTSPDWLDNTFTMIGAELSGNKLGGDLIALKLAEIIFTQAVRHYIETEGKTRPGLAGFADAKIRAALIELHEKPGDTWTVEQLAKVAGMSRTAFSNRFSELIGNSPLNYLTDWRMQVARQMLIDTNSPIIEIALKTGYQSEAAFGRIFKRHFDVPPAGFRRSISKS